MPKPTFGVELHQYLPVATILDEVQLVERLGYDSLWFGDSQMIWRELYVLLGVAAATTSRVLLGTGVTNPVTRHLTVTASAIATLQELSHGRMRMGVGVGFTSVNTTGLPTATRAELVQFVEVVRALCEGETVPSATGSMRLAFGGRGTAPPVLVAAGGPKMLRLAGEIGDGVILARYSCHGEALRAMLRCVREGREASGQPDKSFVVCAGPAVAVHPDRAKALDAVRPHVARALFNPLWPISPAAQRASERMRSAYDVYQHLAPGAGHAASVPDEIVSEFAVAGTPDECREQVRGLFDAGIDDIIIRPYAVDGGTRADMIETFAREVMLPLRG
jgi:5,10-methylenetetrahydromethanopterin reductase